MSRSRSRGWLVQLGSAAAPLPRFLHRTEDGVVSWVGRSAEAHVFLSKAEAERFARNRVAGDIHAVAQD